MLCDFVTFFMASVKSWLYYLPTHCSCWPSVSSSYAFSPPHCLSGSFAKYLCRKKIDADWPKAAKSYSIWSKNWKIFTKITV